MAAITATTALAIASVASTAATVAAQAQAARAQTAANQRQYENTMRARAANLNQTNLMQQQEREAGSQKLEENNMAARAARSTATVAAGENGISGLSVDAPCARIQTWTVPSTSVSYNIFPEVLSKTVVEVCALLLLGCRSCFAPTAFV